MRERVAAQDPPGGEPGGAEHVVLAIAFDGVLRARGLEAAAAERAGDGVQQAFSEFAEDELLPALG